MKRVKLVLLIICLSKILVAQKHFADSVQQILNQSIPDSARAYNMVMLAMYTEPDDIQRAHVLYREAVDFSLSKNLEYWAGIALYYEATPFYLNGEYSLQYNNLTRAKDLLSKSDHYKARNQLGSVYGALSSYYRSIEKLDSAVVASLKSIAIQEELKGYRGLTISCLNLAMIYQQLNLPVKQKEYADKGLAYAKRANQNDIIMAAYLQQSNYYTKMTEFAKANLYVDSASVYYSEKFEFSRKQNYLLVKAGAFQNISMYDSAIYYFQKSHENAEQIGSRWNMAEPLMQIGYINLLQKNYSEAERYLNMGLEIAEADTIRTFMMEGYQTLSEIYAATGRPEEALDFYVRSHEIRDSIQSEERKKFVLDLEKQYETEKKNTELKLQKLEIIKRKGFNHAISGLTFTMLVIFLLVYRNFKQKQKLQEQFILKLEAEKQLSATEAVLKGEEQERTRLAKDLHDGLGGMLSGIKYSLNTMKEDLIMTHDNAKAFERSLDMLDSSIHEMRRVAHNLMPETLLKYGLDTALRDFCSYINGSGVLKLNYQSFGLEKEMPDNSVSISVYRIVQELVSNIIKHADAGSGIVQLTLTGNMLLIDVEDDGKGFDFEKLEFQNGIGWRNIRSRLEYLNGKFEVKSQPGKGTSLHFEIKIK